MTKSFKIGISILFISILTGCSSHFAHKVNQISDKESERSLIHYEFDHTDSFITVAANNRYNKGWFYTFLFGDHYRNEWGTPVTASVIDITKEKDGLSILKKGGSRQTISLRLADSSGNEYVIRSVDKFPASALPERIQHSFFAYLINDATSAAHPYAALALPPMASAVNIYHTNPKLVYLPYDEELGEYKEELGGMLAIFEERPDGDQSNSSFFGNSSRIVSTRKLLENYFEDNDHEIDERFYLRSRIFDMLIGDWSRHEDNWRWASFENEKGYLYKPIPRDRDHAFFKFDGLLPSFVVGVGLKPNFRTFKYNMKNLVKLNKSGGNLDKLILPALSKEDWIQIADSIKLELTDEVIEQAVRAMPDTIFNMGGNEIIQKLKSRRDQLPEALMEYYEYINKSVTITGTDKHEKFLIEHQQNGDVKISVLKILKDGKEQFLISERIFHQGETKQVFVYGLSGKDRFYISGEGKSKIKITLSGGAGEDEYYAKEAFRNIAIEDTPTGNEMHLSSKIKLKYKPNPKAAEFDANGWLLRYYLYN